MAACLSCGKQLQSANPRARYCGVTCRANASKARSKALPEQRPSAVLHLGEQAPAAGSCLVSTVRELEAAGRLDTALGQACLALARRIDANADTGSALAGAVKQLEASLSAALKGAQVVASPLDELRARRDAKRGA